MHLVEETPGIALTVIKDGKTCLTNKNNEVQYCEIQEKPIVGNTYYKQNNQDEMPVQVTLNKIDEFDKEYKFQEYNNAYSMRMPLFERYTTRGGKSKKVNRKKSTRRKQRKARRKSYRRKR
jgi:hypothetical protein